ncbi:MAG: hypothetical protein AAGJ37_12730 [Pseudomonadota bacterium]
MPTPKTICHIVCYRDPDYVRGEVIARALRTQQNYHIVELKNKYKGPLRYFEILLKLIALRFRKNPDVYFLGFRGHEIALFVRLITFGKKMLFDSLVSPTLSLRFESPSPLKSLISKMTFFFEYLILHWSDVIIVDTEIHRKRISDFFNISLKKFHGVYVGAKVPNSHLVPLANDTRFNVLFFGSFLPLHGGDIIFEVAEELKALPIYFTLVGKCKFKPTSKNISVIDWLEYSALTTLIEKSSLCLGGPFGNTPQSQSVITGKTFQFLAFAKATIIGKIEEDVGFKDKTNCLYIDQGCKASLKQAILWAYNNRSALGEIGNQGRDLYNSSFSDRAIASQFQRAMASECK